MSPEDRKLLEQFIAGHGRDQSALIPILLAIQHRYRYLPQPFLTALAEMTEITPAAIQAVSTFYAHFRLRPAGKHTIRVCVGTACHVKGAEQVYKAFRNTLKISGNDDTDAQQLFTVAKVACLGCCMMAPAVQIDDVIYGWVETAQTTHVIEDFLASHAPANDRLPDSVFEKNLGEIKICLCSSCIASGADKIHQELQNCAMRFKLPLRPLDVGCTGMSFNSPFIQITDGAGQIFHYARVDVDAVSSILLHHFKPGSPTHWLQSLLTPGSNPVLRYRIENTRGASEPWIDAQKRIVTEHCGQLPPLDLQKYRDVGGFAALAKAWSLSACEIIDMVTKAKLRGRGGGGFPTGVKWQLAAQASGSRKYIICNGDEGDPGAFMDRMLLESFPFRVIEGMLLAARAIGASQGIFYVREEYPLAIARLRQAIDICYAAGLLGTNIMEQNFHFELCIVKGAGAFVCGEETALIASLEGRRGIPHMRPPYPCDQGLFACPTLINNVETFASIPWIIIHGAEKFGSYGTKGSRGTKTFALAGKVKRGGLLEVPMGMSLRRIVYELGGGIPNERKIKAVQIGGPSGGCVPEHLLDLPVDYEELQAAGAIMGSGGMIVLDEDDCMVDVARYFLSFTATESCGKCTFCRVGAMRMLEILERICAGKGKRGDIDDLEKLCTLVKEGSMCGLGRTAPNPVLSTLKFFREEYLAHIEGHCPSGKCTAISTFIVNENCTGCALCARYCAANAIPYTPWQQARIDQDKCLRCGMCRKTCPENAIKVK